MMGATGPNNSSYEENTAFKEELFGPVAPIIVAQDADDAVRLANKSEFGLGSSVFTKDIEKGKEIALRLEAGQAFVNSFVKSDPRLPFGGVKKSGYGRECSHHALYGMLYIHPFQSALHTHALQ
jgi:succinate-semialdehyde dehydrogenase / glutarate-semialdehyde dehydrogenase